MRGTPKQNLVEIHFKASDLFPGRSGEAVGRDQLGEKKKDGSSRGKKPKTRRLNRRRTTSAAHQKRRRRRGKLRGRTSRSPENAQMSCRAKIPPIPSQFSFFFPSTPPAPKCRRKRRFVFFFVVLLPFFFFKVEQVAAGPFLDGEIGDTQNGTVHLFVSDWGSPGRPQGGPRGLLPEATRKASSFAIRS